MKPRFTIDGSDALENHLAQTCNRVTDGVRRVIPNGELDALLLGGGVLLWTARRLACPTDPIGARACQRLRRISHWLYGIAAFSYIAGAGFAYGLPMLLKG